MELGEFKIKIIPLREKLLNFSFKLMEDRAEAEDIVQEAFLKLWCIWHKLDEYRSVEALAMQVTKNLALDKLRARRPEEIPVENLQFEAGPADPSRRLEEQEAVEHIRSLIGELPSLQQAIIRMKDIEGYELAEIAEITGTQIEAVRVNLLRARKKVREQFLHLNKMKQYEYR
ncbi:MAG: RNA polymerase sigma factor [Tannerellaceae bacterium]|nr:RNA polymerase sigma factor [Tannerellaceae bacterium]